MVMQKISILILFFEFRIDVLSKSEFSLIKEDEIQGLMYKRASIYKNLLLSMRKMLEQSKNKQLMSRWENSKIRKVSQRMDYQVL